MKKTRLHFGDLPPFEIKDLDKNIHTKSIDGERLEMILINHTADVWNSLKSLHRKKTDIIAIYRAEDREHIIDGYHIAARPLIMTFRQFVRIYQSIAKEVETLFYGDMIRKLGVICQKCGHSSRLRSQRRTWKGGRKRACHKCGSTKLRYADIPEPDPWILYGRHRIQT